MGWFNFRFLDVVVGFTCVCKYFCSLYGIKYHCVLLLQKSIRVKKSRLVDFEEESRLVDLCKTRVWTLTLTYFWHNFPTLFPYVMCNVWSLLCLCYRVVIQHYRRRVLMNIKTIYDDGTACCCYSYWTKESPWLMCKSTIT